MLLPLGRHVLFVFIVNDIFYNYVLKLCKSVIVVVAMICSVIAYVGAAAVKNQ